ncbi:MAG: PIN domain-containing protein [Actinomycetota bacterium]|nr:PIN domain-containing protein [Actinomycetota bacterium]
MPAVVLAEATDGHARDVRSAWDSVMSLLGELGRLGMQQDFADELSGAADELLNAYPDRLRERLERSGVLVEPWPDLPHEAITGRAVHRQLPFREVRDGTVGYRDTLVWLTVLAVARSHPDDDVMLVSANRSDFAEKGGEVSLHANLRKEAAREVDGEGSVSLVADLSGLLDELLARPEVREYRDGERLATIREGLRKLHLDLMEATWWPQYDPRDGDYMTGDVDAGIPTVIDNIDLLEIDGPHDLIVEVVGKDGAVEQLRCSYVVHVWFDGIILKSDFDMYLELDEVEFINRDWSDHAMLIGFRRTVRLHIDIGYDPVAHRVESVKLAASEPVTRGPVI